MRITIERRRGEAIAEVCVPLEGTLTTDLFQQLKTSDGPFPFFDTPLAVVHRVKRTRAGYAKYIAPKIEKLLLDGMEARDLFNGYTKDEIKKFREPV